VITIAALLILVFYLGCQFSRTFEAKKQQAAQAEKQLDF
jgi:hypothetical protein